MSIDTKMATAWQRCVEFNAANEVGTAVKFQPVAGQCAGGMPAVSTVTRSVAWVLPNAEAVVMIEGRSGAVGLDAVEVSQ